MANLKSRWPSWPQGAFATRLVIAAMLAFWVSELLGFAHGYSAVFSALIVVRPYQQGALKAGFFRLIATAVGVGTAFVSVLLHRSGLNDYELLFLVLTPLSLLAAYDSSYRTAMISALLMLSAPFAHVPELSIALGRAAVVSLGAVIGIAVSILVLPQPHKHVVADKVVQILRLMFEQLGSSLEPAVDGKAAEKKDQRLRKYLLELGQMTRDHAPKNPDEDASARMVGLTRHAQALSLLLRSQWRRDTLSDDARAERVAICEALRKLAMDLKTPADGEPIKPLFAAIQRLQRDDTPDVPEVWMLTTIAYDLAGLRKLMT